MAKLLDLRGKEIEQPTGLKSDDISDIITHVTKLNEEGRLKGLVFTAIHDDNSTASGFAAGATGFLPALMVGALELAQDTVKRNMVNKNWIPKKS